MCLTNNETKIGLKWIINYSLIKVFYLSFTIYSIYINILEYNLVLPVPKRNIERSLFYLDIYASLFTKYLFIEFHIFYMKFKFRINK